MRDKIEDALSAQSSRELSLARVKMAGYIEDMALRLGYTYRDEDAIDEFASMALKCYELGYWDGQKGW